MKRKGKNRYKKKNRNFLYFKIIFIFYLLLFNLRYISSETSAYFSSQSEDNYLITAGIWEVPEVELDQCVKEIEKDMEANDEIEEDCGNIEDESKEENEEDDTTIEADCKSAKDMSIAGNHQEAVPSKKIKVNCSDKEDEVETENEKDTTAQDEDVTKQVDKESDKLEDKSTEAAKENETQAESDANKEKVEQKPVDYAQKQSDNKANSVDELKENITTKEQTEKVEGDSIEKEKEKENANEKDSEVGK